MVTTSESDLVTAQSEFLDLFGNSQLFDLDFFGTASTGNSWEFDVCIAWLVEVKVENGFAIIWVFEVGANNISDDGFISLVDDVKFSGRYSKFDEIGSFTAWVIEIDKNILAIY